MYFNFAQLSCSFASIFLVISACSNNGGIETGADVSSNVISNEAQQNQSSQESVFEVDGIRVISFTSLSELPEAASKVEFTSTIIDSGSGPEICIGAVLTSLPPQCNGPIIDGLVMGDWAETASRVSWGERTVVVSWPPNEDSKLTLFSDRESEERTSQINDGFPVPDECVNLDWNNTVAIELLASWADANPEISGIAYFSRDFGSLEQLSQEEKDQLLADLEQALAEEQEAANTIGIGVLQVVEGYAETANDELAADGKVPCITEVEHSMADLQQAQDIINSEDLYRTAYMTSNAIGGVSNKLAVGVAVADLSTVGIVAEKLENPSMLVVSGTAKILEGE